MMTASNIHTPKLRLPIYEKVLQFVKDNILKDNDVCILLPTTWLDCKILDTWIDNDGNIFTHESTPEYFPEFGKYFHFKPLKYKEIYLERDNDLPIPGYVASRIAARNKWRIKILEEIISNIKNISYVE